MEGERKLISNLLEIGVVKFGEFILKSGGISPIYIDLRVIVGYPKIVKDLAELIWAKKIENNLCADVICGVPYTALPIASVLSVLRNVPLLIKRKEIKNYGTKKMVEGVFKKGDKCLIIEDIVSSGSSVIETADVLLQEGLNVTDCIVVLDRKQGGKQNLAERGITLHSILDLEYIISTVCIMEILSTDMEKNLKTYFTNNSFIAVKNQKLSNTLSFSDRKGKSDQPIAKKLFDIIDSKQSNLCVALDVLKSSELLHLADILGPHVCILKTHIDILNDFSEETVTELLDLAQKHNFLVFEDRKFADIGNTVKHQYRNGVYRISQWADIVTVHCFPGEAVVESLKSGDESKPRSCVLIAQMSSKGALQSDEYIKTTAEIAEKHKDFVIGFISQSRVSDNSGFIHMCPGVSLNIAGDSLGQQYKTPENAVIEMGADVIIVGRGITEAEDIIETAKEYKLRAFEAYKARISNNV